MNELILIFAGYGIMSFVNDIIKYIRKGLK